MRGRSAFIQLLGHALIQRILQELNLSQANVIYDAGGNFLLLTGWDDKIADQIKDIAQHANRVLLQGIGQGKDRFDGFHGDLAVALAAVQIPLEAIAYQPLSEKSTDGAPPVSWIAQEGRIKEAIAQAKARPFGDLALADKRGWESLFAPEPAETDVFCAVCRRQKGEKEVFYPLDRDIPEDISIRSNSVCPECWGFNQLANDLGHRGAKLLLQRTPPESISSWQRCLFEISDEWWYRIGESGDQGDLIFALDLDAYPNPGVDSLRLMEHTTPMDGRIIKPNDQLARASEGGMKRLGVLRMDVDDLGSLLVYGLPNRTLAQTSEISQTLERFFAGWLGSICKRLDKGQAWFYVLFAGGDDLFILGPWSAMPTLAQSIYDDFKRYAGHHPALHLSAGIAVIGEKSPLYAASEEAKSALEASKHHANEHGELTKDAITFLGQTYPWQAFATVTGLQEFLKSLVSKDGKQLPKGLLTTLQAIHQRYQQDHITDKVIGQPRGKEGVYESTGKRLFLGPWMWKQAYTLHRIGRQRNATGEMESLQKMLLSDQIEILGLAARWAQWLTRSER
jgi:CRISPR-associated protein Csm1